MFSPLYARSRATQPVTFLASLSLQCALVALLCLLPAPKMHGPSLRPDNLHAALTTPLYFEPAVQPVSVKPGAHPELPSAAKAIESQVPPVEAKIAGPEAKPAEAEATAAAATGGEGTSAIAPFPAWKMNSNTGAHGFHHQASKALPVFTPEPPILRSDFPESARGKAVVLQVVINEEGSIVAFQVLQGVGDGVERAIVETLRRWIYVPAKFNGMAIASQQELRFQFPG